MYRPPSSNLSEFIDNIESTFLKFNKMLFVGDVNVDVLKQECSSHYINLIDALGFRILNMLSKNNATRYTRTSDTIIDHAITSLPEYQFGKIPIELIETSLSDHKALKMSYMLSTFEKSEFTCKEFQRIDYSNYSKLVTDNLKDKINVTIVELILILQSAKIKSTKIIRKTVRKESFRWITLSILDMMEERDKLFKYWSKHRNNLELKTKYEALCNKIKKQVNSAKTELQKLLMPIIVKIFGKLSTRKLTQKQKTNKKLVKLLQTMEKF